MVEQAAIQTTEMQTSNKNQRRGEILLRRFLMDKALPARTETSGFASESSRASLSTSKAAWGPSQAGGQNTLCYS